MTKRDLLVGPFNRVEGDLEVRLEVDEAAGKVTAAYANSPLFRGFETMLQGRDPRDALTLTPRICGICSISQSTAAALALGDVAGVKPTPQGALAAAILHGVENLADHATHFALFFMPDFARADYADRPWHPQVAERFLATRGSTARALADARSELLHIVGLLGGKWPHTLAIQPAGVTRAPDARDRIRIKASLRAFRRFLEDRIFGGTVEEFAALQSASDLAAWTGGEVGLFQVVAKDLGLADMGAGPGRYLSFGAYPTDAGRATQAGLWSEGSLSPVDMDGIREEVAQSWMLGDALHPREGVTEPDEDMQDPAYSWCKAPRLNGQTVEVGALARAVVDGHPLALSLVQQGGGVAARIGGRLLEIARTQLWLEAWTEELDPTARFMGDFEVPTSGQGVGLTEAARGSLGHWITIEDGRIDRYQIIAPTTWNFSPRDGEGVPGPLESALVGAPVRPDEEAPLSVQHIVRSFDPCMVCTVH